MKKNSKNSKPSHSSDVKKNYNLKSDAVEDLANADKVKAPSYSEKELNKYRSKKGLKIPENLKVPLIKTWFAGAVCFFFLWGLGTYIGSMLDMLFILGLALGVVTDLLTNSVIRFMEVTPGANDKWMMYPKKNYIFLFLNIFHAMVIILGVFYIYEGINWVITTITGNPDAVPLGVEPILFGVFCTAVDTCLIALKRLILDTFRKIFRR